MVSMICHWVGTWAQRVPRSLNRAPTALATHEQQESPKRGRRSVDPSVAVHSSPLEHQWLTYTLKSLTPSSYRHPWTPTCTEHHSVHTTCKFVYTCSNSFGAHTLVPLTLKAHTFRGPTCILQGHSLSHSGVTISVHLMTDQVAGRSSGRTGSFIV